MKSFFNRLISNVEVSQESDLIKITGIPTGGISHQIMKIWSTSKITQNIFTRLTPSLFAFDKFFAPDILYTFKTIVEKKRRGFNPKFINKAIEGLQTNTWLKDIDKQVRPWMDWASLKELVWAPLDHQLGFAQSYERVKIQYHLRGYLAAADPGAGKTFMGLMMGLLTKSDVNIFIVPLNSVELVWKEHFSNAYKKPKPYWISTDGTEPEVGGYNYAFHYEQLDKAIELAQKLKGKRIMLWLDESHNFNEMTSQRTQKFIELSRSAGVRDVFWASGTAIKALGREVIPLLKTIDPYFNVDAQRRFEAIFGKSSSRALDILQARLGRMKYTVRKEQFKAKEPDPIRVNVKIPNGKDYTLDAVRQKMRAFIDERAKYYAKHKDRYQRFYDLCVAIYARSVRSAKDRAELQTYKSYVKTMSKGFDPFTMRELAVYCNLFEKEHITPLLTSPAQRQEWLDAKTVVKYVSLKIQGETLGRVLGKMREQCIVDMVPYIDLPRYIDEAQKKTLIFTSYVDAVVAASEYLTQEGYIPLEVYGKTNKDLTGIVEVFGGNEDLNPLIATYASLSTAVPLVMANVCLMLNAPFRDHIYKQAVSRVDRLGQDTEVQIYIFYLDTGNEPNLSTRAGDILQWCKEQVAQIMGVDVDLPEGDEILVVESAQDIEQAYLDIKPRRKAWLDL